MRARGLAGAAAALLLVGCASGSDADDAADDAAAYAAVVRHVVGARPADATDERPFVYVEGRDEVIDLETQAGVVTELEDEIDVRFVDERGEAVEEDDPGEPVRGDSVLLRLGPVSTGGDPVEVEVERYRSLDDVEELRLELARRGEGWTVSASSPSGASR